MSFRTLFLGGGVVLAVTLRLTAAVHTFSIATYNVENYLTVATESRKIKPEDSRTKVRDVLSAIRADVVALQEMGEPAALHELRESLRRVGLEYSHWDHIRGWDTNIHIAILSRFPIVAKHPHTNDSFLLMGKRFHVSRGFAEVDVQVAPNYRFTLIACHLKSRRQIGQADEADLRAQEAEALRTKVDDVLRRNRRANLVVLGDLNDTKDTPSVRSVIGQGSGRLFDTRPAERGGDTVLTGRSGTGPRNVAWTHFYAKEDSYNRFDYILLSAGMKNEWISEGTYIPTIPNWGLASDHRPLVATFMIGDQ